MCIRDSLTSASVARWHIGQSVSSDFSLYSLFIYLFSKLTTHTYIYFPKKVFTVPYLLVLRVHCCRSIFYLLYLILKAQFVQLLLQDERFAFSKDIQLDSVFAAVKAKVPQVKPFLLVY